MAAKTAAVQPVKVMGTGPITVMMLWGVQLDIDLHIMEPDGSHVYFYQRKGKSGLMDVEDT